MSRTPTASLVRCSMVRRLGPRSGSVDCAPEEGGEKLFRCLMVGSPAAEPHANSVDDTDREERGGGDQQGPLAAGGAEYDGGEPGRIAERAARQDRQRGWKIHRTQSCNTHHSSLLRPASSRIG